MINNRFKFKHWQGSKVWLSSLRAQQCWPKKTLAALYVEIIISDSGQQVQVSGYACYLERPVLLWQHEIAPCPAGKKKHRSRCCYKNGPSTGWSISIANNQITDCALMDMHGCWYSWDTHAGIRHANKSNLGWWRHSWQCCAHTAFCVLRRVARKCRNVYILFLCWVT